VDSCALAVLFLAVACGGGSGKTADTVAADRVSEIAQDIGGRRDAAELAGAQDAVAEFLDSGRAVPEDGIEEQDACQPNCEGRECGDDSCSGSCGTCPESIGGQAVYQCTPEGHCVLLKITGVSCSKDAECVSGWCVQTSQGSICSVPCIEECPGGWICEKVSDIEPYNACVPCVPNCEGKECGDDGCGGECGHCPTAQVCVEGLCQCEPDCEDKECGENDGCGNPCGDCPLECTDHGECGQEELCLRTGGYYFADLPEPTVCGLCGTVTECTCRVPLWKAKFNCNTDADCTGKFFCYTPCGEEPGEIPCPHCVHGWCAYETHLNEPAVCSGSCGGG
jgi:hypothetical protein